MSAPPIPDASDPLDILRAWFADAVQSEQRVPDAMQLATVGPEGRPSVRTVLLKALGPDGLDFYTNRESRKARELAQNPRAAICLHWKSLQRQVLAEGVVAPLGDEESDAYWATRPRGSQIGAWASEQSRPVASVDALYARVAELAARFAGGDVPRPPHWGGYRLRPDRYEFWQGQDDRLHDRVEYTRVPTGWTRRLLQP